jgi:hypothetical protein
MVMNVSEWKSTLVLLQGVQSKEDQAEPLHQNAQFLQGNKDLSQTGISQSIPSASTSPVNMNNSTDEVIG